MKFYVRHHRWKDSAWTVIKEPFEAVKEAEAKLFALAQESDPFEGEIVVSKPVIIRRVVREKGGTIYLSPVIEVIESIER